MPANGISSAKRSRSHGRRSDGDAQRKSKVSRNAKQDDEEAQLVASLFGGSMPLVRRQDRDGVDSDDEADEDGLDGVYGKGSSSSTGDGVAEQYLDDEELFVVDHGDAQEGGSDIESADSSDARGTDESSTSSEDEDDGHDDKLEGPSERRIDARHTISGSDRRRKPAWTDPATASVIIPLVGRQVGEQNGTFAGTQKQRKLRENADETELTGLEYELRLRKKFEELHPRPAWASHKRARADASSTQQHALADLLSRDSGLVKGLQKRDKAAVKVRRSLQPGSLDVQRLRNGNEALGRANLSQIEALEFHPSARAHVMLTASKDRRLRLFQINGTTNPHLETIHFPDLPLKTAHFDPTGSSVVVSGPRPFFYAHDLESGKTTKSAPWRAFGSNDEATQERDLSNLAFAPDESVHGQRRRLAVGGRRGAIYLLDWGQIGGSGGASMLGTLRMNAPLAGMAWDPLREHTLVSMSTQGTLHTWDVRNMNCTVQRSDAGLFAPLNLAASPAGGNFWAAGSDSGIVNIYGRTAVERPASSKEMSGATLPLDALKSVDNIVTASTTLRFNATGEILAIGSDKKRDAFKLLHLPSLRVFDNWPTSGTPLGRITAADFSRHSQYLALGNHRGKVLLYSLPHFQQ